MGVGRAWVADMGDNLLLGFGGATRSGARKMRASCLASNFSFLSSFWRENISLWPHNVTGKTVSAASAAVDAIRALINFLFDSARRLKGRA